MVVPSATGVDLLTEHAWYEYGRPEYQSVINFDYIHGEQDFVRYCFPSHWKNILYLAILTTLVVTVVKSSIFSRSKHQASSFKAHERPFLNLTKKREYDLEEALPELSHSNSSTPASSPHMSRDQLRMNNFSFDDNHTSLHSKNGTQLVSY